MVLRSPKIFRKRKIYHTRRITGMHADENDFEIFGSKLDSGFRSFTLNLLTGKKFISQFFFTIVLLFLGF
jgi:hypothetical protein